MKGIQNRMIQSNECLMRMVWRTSEPGIIARGITEESRNYQEVQIGHQAKSSQSLNCIFAASAILIVPSFAQPHIVSF